MGGTDEQWQAWVFRLAAGDPAVVEEFCRDYGPRLQGLAAQHVSAGLRRREEPEDIVQSVCRTFLRRAKAGQFGLQEEGSLWRLLCAITLTKIREKERFHRRQKRGLDREQPLDPASDRSPAALPPPGKVVPSPAEAAEFAEQLAILLADLDDEQRAVAELKLQDYTNEEAARALRCSERTVRRILHRVQVRWQRILDPRHAPDS